MANRITIPIVSKTAIDLGDFTALVVEHYGELENRDAITRAARVLARRLNKNPTVRAKIVDPRLEEDWDVRRLRLKPGDKILLRLHSEHLTLERAQRLREEVGSHFPGHEVVAASGCDFTILHEETVVE